MGRIRSIKPEILEDEKTAHLSHLEWRLFVSLWLLADDQGNLRGEPGYIQGAALWASRESREEVAKAIESLARLSLVSLYRVRGQLYLHIAGWDKHQKVDKPGRPRVPQPTDSGSVFVRSVTERTEPIRESVAETSRESRESPANDLRSPTSDLTSDHDPEGSTRETTSPDSAAASPGGAVPNPSKATRKRKQKPSEPTPYERAVAKVLLEKLGERNGISYTGAPDHVRLIANRLRDGLTELDLRSIIAHCAVDLEWAEPGHEMAKYLRPETLFGPKTYTRYLDPARKFMADTGEVLKPIVPVEGEEAAS